MVAGPPLRRSTSLVDSRPVDATLDRSKVALVDSEKLKRPETEVMKFVLGVKGYVAFRMTYRGKGGWSWPLASGKLPHIVKRLVKHIGTDEFYELM
jgi:hypothetical protein